MINSLLDLHSGQYRATSLLKINVTQCGKHNDGNNMLLISHNVPGELCVCIACMCFVSKTKAARRKLTTEPVEIKCFVIFSPGLFHWYNRCNQIITFIFFSSFLITSSYIVSSSSLFFPHLLFSQLSFVLLISPILHFFCIVFCFLSLSCLSHLTPSHIVSSIPHFLPSLLFPRPHHLGPLFFQSSPPPEGGISHGNITLPSPSRSSS